MFFGQIASEQTSDFDPEFRRGISKKQLRSHFCFRHKDNLPACFSFKKKHLRNVYQSMNIINIINIQPSQPGVLRNGSAPRQILLHQIGCPVGFTFWICSFDKLIRDAGWGELDDGWKFFQDVFAENSNPLSF